MIFLALLTAVSGLLGVLPVRRIRHLPRRDRARVAMGLAFAGAGTTHVADPRPFLQMMPGWVPFPVAMVYVTGVLEVAGGLALLVPRLQRPAALALAAYLVAVFPANVNVAVNGIAVDRYPGGWYPWLRLPFQLLFIWWVLWSADAGRGLGQWARREGSS